MNRPLSERVRPDAKAGGRSLGWSTHFHDYTPAAFRMWLAIVVAGAAALIWALATLGAASFEQQLNTLVGLLFVAMAAWFPVVVPRTKYSISAADAFIFTMLAVLGPAAAILAAGCDGMLGALRSTRRLTSRLSTPGAAMAAMATSAALFSLLWPALAGITGNTALAKFAALVLVGIVPFSLTSLPLMATVTLKHGLWPDMRDWFSSLSWMAAIYIGAALAAGVVQLVAAQQGLAALVIMAVGVLGVVILLRVSIAKGEVEHAEQEARISDAQREAEANQQRFAAAFSDAAIGMAIVEPGGRVLRANRALCTLLGKLETDLVGESFVSVLDPIDVDVFERQAREVATQGDNTAYSIELRCNAGGGSEIWVALHCGRFSDPQGSVDGLIYQVHDITSRQVAESRLQHIAFHDNLTDLANRACFHEQLGAAVEASRMNPDVRFAVMFLDLDRFKVVNDSLGHFAGNELLREVGRRLIGCVRPSDLVARLGGDEFAMLIRDPGNVERGVQLAQHMLVELRRPICIIGTDIAPSASVGITFSDLGYRSVDELLRDADLAMYEAKAAGRSRVVVFDRTMHERIADKLSLEADLRRAIGEGELSLDYQPVFDLEPYRLVGFEALARWIHPTRGPVSPATFIAVAEEAGHIEALTECVLERALEQLAAWHRLQATPVDLGMNVNISARDLMQPDFADRVQEKLERYRIDPRLLTLEITESVLMNHLDLALDSLLRLRAAGTQLAIDDFGTGYSSLAYLGTLPIDCLKIDRSFVTAMNHGVEGVEILRAVLTLGQALGKKVVAEGIETQAQLETLRRLGVHAGQGFLLSRPLSPAQVRAVLLENTVAG